MVTTKHSPNGGTQTVDKLGVGDYAQHHFSLKLLFFLFSSKSTKIWQCSNLAFSRIFASFFKFMHAKVSPAFISIRAFPTYCVYRNPCCSSIIATIGSGSLVYGLNYMYSHGSPVLTGIPTEFNQLTLTRIGGKLPVNILYMATISLILWIMLNRTELGERIKAVGGNIVSAKLAGIRSDRIKIIAYIICAMCCAVTGILLASVMGAGTTSACDAYMVNSFAAVYVGSATLKDGEFHIVGTLIGVLITTIAFNGLAILGIDTYAQYLFQGFIILFSVALSSVARKYAIK